MNRRLNNAEEQISDLENRIKEITQTKEKTERQIKKKKSNIHDLWDNIKWSNLHKRGVPEGKKRQKGIKNIFEETVAENFPNLKKETDI